MASARARSTPASSSPISSPTSQAMPVAPPPPRTTALLPLDGRCVLSTSATLASTEDQGTSCPTTLAVTPRSSSPDGSVGVGPLVPTRRAGPTALSLGLRSLEPANGSLSSPGHPRLGGVRPGSAPRGRTRLDIALRQQRPAPIIERLVTPRSSPWVHETDGHSLERPWHHCGRRSRPDDTRCVPSLAVEHGFAGAHQAAIVAVPDRRPGMPPGG